MVVNQNLRDEYYEMIRISDIDTYKDSDGVVASILEDFTTLTNEFYAKASERRSHQDYDGSIAVLRNKILKIKDKLIVSIDNAKKYEDKLRAQKLERKEIEDSNNIAREANEISKISATSAKRSSLISFGAIIVSLVAISVTDKTNKAPFLPVITSIIGGNDVIFG